MIRSGDDRTMSNVREPAWPKGKGAVAWPYPLEWDTTQVVETDILVLGGGAAGCFAALGARERGASVVLVEKGAAATSGAAGSGCDHWESAASNPCSRVTPEEVADGMVRAFSGYNNGISHYIECREGYDRLLDLEDMGGKVRDTGDEFKGADFRDEKTKLLFAYDYVNRFHIRVWGTTFKPALAKACRRRGVKVFDRVMAAGLLTEGGRLGARVAGAVGFNVRTGRFMVFKAKAVVLATSRPTRMWLFSAELPGISEFRPLQSCGDGHAMAWRAGAAFTMMEKSVQGEWSGLRSFPPYGTGNNHNTWYPCTLVDAEGRVIPWADRDGRILENFAERLRPSPGQKFYLKGGGEPNRPVYEFQGPETLPTDELLRRGYKLPFYADPTSLPEMERRVIWGMMVGQEGKTRIPILEAYERGGFDPRSDLLQSYGDGWKSGSFLPQERQLFGLPGGLVNDWELMTNVPGLFAAGDALFASDCFGHAAATGHYAGRHAAAYAARAGTAMASETQIESERTRIYAPAARDSGPDWRELNTALTRIMQNYCGAFKTEKLLRNGLTFLDDLWKREGASLAAANPHELMRAVEVLDIITNAGLVMEACLARRASSRELEFSRLDYPEIDPPEWRKFVTVKLGPQGAESGGLALDYYGHLAGGYEAHNPDYQPRSGR